MTATQWQTWTCAAWLCALAGCASAVGPGDASTARDGGDAAVCPATVTRGAACTPGAQCPMVISCAGIGTGTLACTCNGTWQCPYFGCPAAPDSGVGNDF